MEKKKENGNRTTYRNLFERVKPNKKAKIREAIAKKEIKKLN